mgnify:CR=1 FL=1
MGDTVEARMARAAGDPARAGSPMKMGSYRRDASAR